MEKSEIDEKILDQIRKLEEKYEVMGQDLSSYLDGLLYSDYLTYWEYIHLDTLLSLQNPKTGMEDEMIFIIYHQHTELFFKLIRWELDQMIEKAPLPADHFLEKLRRINRYFSILENSFSVMVDGMDKEQFLRFRMSLLPASGFQSAQYRLIEIASTDLINLVAPDYRDQVEPTADIPALIEHIYWRQGSMELASGKKTLTLKQFEEKYMGTFIEEGNRRRERNLLQLYQKYYRDDELAPEVVAEMKKFDLLANVFWPLAHYKSAVRYLHRDPGDIAATGGTNWQKYLPPRFQRIMFFPELWSDKEKKEWGMGWVMKTLEGLSH